MIQNFLQLVPNQKQYLLTCYRHVLEDLYKTKSFKISLANKNFKKIYKSSSTVVRYFLPNCGVQNRIIHFIYVPGETSDLQCVILKKVSNKSRYKAKLLF